MSTVKFINREFANFEKEDNTVIAVEVDMQGAWETQDLKMMRWAFPKTYKYYHDLCFYKVPLTGSVILSEEDGYTIALLVTKTHRKDQLDIAITNFESCLEDLKRLVPSNKVICSPILGRKDKGMIKYGLTIGKIFRSEKRLWHIYRRNDNATN